MELNELKKFEGATHSRKRVGRGAGSGLGKTSGRGENGQKSRSGASISPVFEGGQSPLFRRLHKRGFSNAKFKTVYATINVGELSELFNDGDIVTPELLKEKGIIKKQVLHSNDFLLLNLRKKIVFNNGFEYLINFYHKNIYVPCKIV